MCLVPGVPGVVCCFVCFLKLRAPWQSSWGHSPARLHGEGRGPGPPLPAQAPQGRQALPSAKPLQSPHVGIQPCFKECLVFSPSRKIYAWIYSSVDFIVSRCLPVLVALNDLWIVWCTHAQANESNSHIAVEMYLKSRIKFKYPS